MLCIGAFRGLIYPMIAIIPIYYVHIPEKIHQLIRGLTVLYQHSNTKNLDEAVVAAVFDWINENAKSILPII